MPAIQPRPEQPSTTVGTPTMHYLIEAEAHTRAALRLVELDPSDEARREAGILQLVAQRLRARRLAA